MLRPPPRSTLTYTPLPYTTLFRSAGIRNRLARTPVPGAQRLPGAAAAGPVALRPGGLGRRPGSLRTHAAARPPRHRAQGLLTCPLSQGHLLLRRVQYEEHTAPVGQISIGGRTGPGTFVAQCGGALGRRAFGQGTVRAHLVVVLAPDGDDSSRMLEIGRAHVGNPVTNGHIVC